MRELKSRERKGLVAQGPQRWRVRLERVALPLPQASPLPLPRVSLLHGAALGTTHKSQSTQTSSLTKFSSLISTEFMELRGSNNSQQFSWLSRRQAGHCWELWRLPGKYQQISDAILCWGLRGWQFPFTLSLASPGQSLKARPRLSCYFTSRE